MSEPATAPLFSARAGRVSVVAVAAGGAFIAGGGANGVAIFETAGKHRTFQSAAPRGVSALAFAADRETLIVGGELGELRAWNFLKDASRALPPHTGTVRALAFAQQDRYLASAGSDGAIRFTNLADSGQAPAPIRYSDAVTSLAWSADGRLLAYGSKDKAIHFVDLKSPDHDSELHFHDDSPEALAFSADGARLVSISRDLGAQTWSLASLPRPPATSSGLPGTKAKASTLPRSVSVCGVCSDASDQV